MKYLRQFAIILAISLLGEIIHALIPLPIPASIYGIILLFLALECKILPLHAIRETSAFLVDIMPLLFIPAGVGLLDKWSILQEVLLPFAVIVVVSTFVVMAVSGRVTQAVIRRGQKKEER